MFAHRTNQQNQLQNRFSFGYVFCWLSFAPISVPEALKISVDECKGKPCILDRIIPSNNNNNKKLIVKNMGQKK
ncbi:hypothetical protein DERP_013068, partial [Dermatophagoides pteronyssinus]